MATVVLDFDSTVISCESLEIILEQKLAGQAALQERVRQITELGIRGSIPFEESLRNRLSIAAPEKKEVEAFGQQAHRFLTSGMQEMVDRLALAKTAVWIVSGGIIESLLPLGRMLKIPEKRIHGVRLLWGEGGKYLGIDQRVAFCRSKVEGCRPFAREWLPPRVAIGDAMSDFRLYEAGLVDHFIAYTEHFRCDEVLNKGVRAAKNCVELEEILTGILNG